MLKLESGTLSQGTLAVRGAAAAPCTPWVCALCSPACRPQRRFVQAGAGLPLRRPCGGPAIARGSPAAALHERSCLHAAQRKLCWPAGTGAGKGFPCLSVAANDPSSFLSANSH